MAAGTTVFGTPASGNYAPSTGATFSGRDNEPSGLNVTVAGTNVVLTATGDSHSSDVVDLNTNGSTGGNALRVTSGGGTVLGVQGSTAGSLTVAGTSGTAGTVLLGDAGSSGGVTLAAPAAGSGTQTFQAATDTVVDRSTTDTLTNKTFITASSANSVSQLSSIMNQTSSSGTSVTAVSYSLPANTLCDSHRIRIDPTNVPGRSLCPDFGQPLASRTNRFLKPHAAAIRSSSLP